VPATQQPDTTEKGLCSTSLLRQAYSCNVFYGRDSTSAERPNNRLQSNSDRRPFFSRSRPLFWSLPKLICHLSKIVSSSFGTTFCTNLPLLTFSHLMTYIYMSYQNGENYIMRSLVICTPYPIFCGW